MSTAHKCWELRQAAPPIGFSWCKAHSHKPVHGGFPGHLKCQIWYQFKPDSKIDSALEDFRKRTIGDPPFEFKTGPVDIDKPEVDERDEVACPECAETVHCWNDGNVVRCQCMNDHCVNRAPWNGATGRNLEEAVKGFAKMHNLK